MKTRILLGLALAALTAGVYLRGLDHGFVSLDDPVYVTRNRHVQAGLTGESVGWAFTTFHGANWHPLTWLSHMADVELSGMDAGSHHVTNAVLHGLNALLLFAALVLLTGRHWPSLFAAALFALHPQRVESVAWISERKDVLAGTFWMATLLAYGWYARAPGIGRYLLVALALSLGLLAKPMGVTLPFVLLLLDFWPLKRQTPFGKLVLEKAPLFLIAAVSCVVTVMAQRSGGSVSPLEILGWGPRIANTLLAYGLYLWKFLWPANLACFYPHPGHVAKETFSLLSASVIAATLVLVAVTVAAVRLRKRAPYAPMGWLWFLGTLVPVIGLLQVGAQSLADRYTYAPMIGVAIAIAWGAAAAARCCNAGRVVVPVAAVLWLGALSVATWRQVGTWKDSETLYLHALAVTEANYRAMNNYGIVLESRGDLEGAEELYRAARTARPGHPKAAVNLGVVLQKQSRFDEARVLYEEALATDPNMVEALSNLGALHLVQQDPSRALTYLERAVRADPEHVSSLRNLGLLHKLSGNTYSAVQAYEKVFELRPGDPQAAYDLGIALANDGRRDEAIEAMRAALALEPTFAPARQALQTLGDRP